MPRAKRPPAARDGASRRYAALFRAHYPKVVRWLTVLGIPPGSADDVAQEVFIIAHRKLDQLRPDASPSAWLLGISRRVGATHRRSHMRAKARDKQAAPPEELPNPEAVAMRSQAAQLLQDFLASLPEEQRLVFVLYEMDGANATEIAQALDLSPNTVHSRIRLIREKLARVVARQRAKGNATHG